MVRNSNWSIFLLSLLATTFTSCNTQQTSHKEIAIEIHQKLYNQNRTIEFDKATSEDYVFHSEKDISANELSAQISKERKENPESYYNIKRVVGNDHTVLIHSHKTLRETDRGNDHAEGSFSVADVYRFEKDLIVEQWHIEQAVNPKSINGNTMFDGTSSPEKRTKNQLDANKQSTDDYFDELFNNGNMDFLDKVMREDFIAHSPMEPNGRDSLKALFQKMLGIFPSKLYVDSKANGAEGNMTFRVNKYGLEGMPDVPGYLVDILAYDKNGKIKEHWDIVGQRFDFDPKNKITLTNVEAGGVITTTINKGWPDVESKNAIASIILKALGYQPEIRVQGLRQTYELLESGKADVFMGNWMPTLEKFYNASKNKGSIETIGINLKQGRYSLATPTYMAERGLKSFKDIAKFKNELNYQIHGIDPGYDMHEVIQKVIDASEFGLMDFSINETSQDGMFKQVAGAYTNKKAIVFMAWEPHPMNQTWDLTYLDGGDNYFGKNYGEFNVYTLTRKDFIQQNSNVGQLIKNLVFTKKMENEIMGYILDDSIPANQAAENWLKSHPEHLKAWLKGVKTIDGKDGLKAIERYLSE